LATEAIHAAPAAHELVAPAAWQAIDFISDLHLNYGDPATFALWQRYMQTTPADAVFILGDLFEIWVGDDAVNINLPASGGGSFEDDCAAVLRDTAQRCAVYFMHGNRDFLVGSPPADAARYPRLMSLCGFTLLPDPTVLTFDGRRWLLSHGDALCLADTRYLDFRALVRHAAWQQDFLSRPMAERHAVALQLRRQSEAAQSAVRDAGLPFADVDTDAALAWLEAAGAPVLIHGHTHRPADHDLGQGARRIVMTDWDASPAANPPRAEVLRLVSGSALRRIPLAA
jgi:UDP-2,3-diacylglucosamine hydrolase